MGENLPHNGIFLDKHYFSFLNLSSTPGQQHTLVFSALTRTAECSDKCVHVLELPAIKVKSQILHRWLSKEFDMTFLKIRSMRMRTYGFLETN